MYKYYWYVPPGDDNQSWLRVGLEPLYGLYDTAWECHSKSVMKTHIEHYLERVISNEYLERKRL